MRDGTGNGIRIRRATVADALFIAEMTAQLLSELSGSPRQAADFVETAQTIAAADQHLIYVGQVGGDAIGMITASEAVSLYANGTYGVIQELYVLPAERSRGVGIALLHAVREEGERRRWSRLEVGAPDARVWARTVAFYKRAGFAEIGPRLKMMLEQN